jgi:hypothetical protein
MAMRNGKPAANERERTERLREKDRARFPGLHSYALFDEWTESHDVWLEYMTGEFNDGRVRRDPDL